MIHVDSVHVNRGGGCGGHVRADVVVGPARLAVLGDEDGAVPARAQLVGRPGGRRGGALVVAEFASAAIFGKRLGRPEGGESLR